MTHFTPQLNEVASAVDSLGNLHVFANVTTSFDPPINREYYLRASPYGQILTDTVQLNADVATVPDPISTCAVSDRQSRVWLIWTDLVEDLPRSERSLYMAGRDATGNELFPPTIVGRGGAGGGFANESMSAVYRPEDETIHILQAYYPGMYSRITATGDTLIWRHRLPENRMPVYPRIKIDSHGTPWGAMRYDNGQPADIALFRFSEDTSLTLYYPFGYMTGQRWGIYDFAIDRFDNFHFLVYHDSTYLSYCRLDSTFQLQEWRTLVRQSYCSAALRFNASGECVIVWSTMETYPVIRWLLRDSLGEWSGPPRVLANSLNTEASFLSLIDMPQGGWVLTCKARPPSEQNGNALMFTYGLPPNNVPSIRPASRIPTVSVYPNPFRSLVNIEFPVNAFDRLSIHDLLGRVVLTIPIPANSGSERLDESSVSSLPSGQYFIRLIGDGQTHSIPIMHLR